MATSTDITKPISDKWCNIARMMVWEGLPFTEAGRKAGYEDNYVTGCGAIQIKQNPRFKLVLAKEKEDKKRADTEPLKRWRDRCEYRTKEAWELGDRTTAKGYDDMLGKSYGVYEEDNKQKQAENVTDIMALVGISNTREMGETARKQVEARQYDKDGLLIEQSTKTNVVPNSPKE